MFIFLLLPVLIGLTSSATTTPTSCAINDVAISIECDHRLNQLNATSFPATQATCCSVYDYNTCIKKMIGPHTDDECNRVWVKQTAEVDLVYSQNGCTQYYCPEAMLSCALVNYNCGPGAYCYMSQCKCMLGHVPRKSSGAGCEIFSCKSSDECQNRFDGTTCETGRCVCRSDFLLNIWSQECYQEVDIPAHNPSTTRWWAIRIGVGLGIFVIATALGLIYRRYKARRVEATRRQTLAPPVGRF